MEEIPVTSEVPLAWVRCEAELGVEAAPDAETTVVAIDDESVTCKNIWSTSYFFAGA